MRKLVVLCLTITFVLAGASLALAAGYLSDATIQGMVAPDDPHGGYSTTSNKCKACHAVHLAEGSYRLLRADTPGEECAYCHGTGGIITAIQQVDGQTTNGHTMNATTANITAPDDVDATPFVTEDGGLKCADCHSVHDNGTVRLAGNVDTKILKQNPDGSGADFINDVTTLSEWCADCHDANFGLHNVAIDKDGNVKQVGVDLKYGHDSSSDGVVLIGADLLVEPGDSVNNGPTCNECHSNTGFPHDSLNTAQEPEGPSAMLRNTYDDAADEHLDEVCMDCHPTGTLP